MNEAMIRKYQQRCFWHYSEDVGLPCPYTYPDGNPIRPLPPLQTACGGLMIVGAYPSARFEARPSAEGRKRLVPVGDNLHPFAEELYFDGVQARRLESGHQIRRHLLDPLGVSHEACWITDLVKVFLYKPSHRDSVGAVHPDFSVPVTRGRFAEFAKRSLPWLQQECELCQPSLVVTLGEEVAQVVSREPKAKADDLLNRDIGPVPILDDWPVLHLPHPDACRRSEKWASTMVRRVRTAATWLAR